MAKILVAASPEERVAIEGMLAEHDLNYAENMAQATQCLHLSTFDLIVCSILFDKSRMFDLLRFSNSRPEWQKIPFVCCRVRPDMVASPIALKGIAFTCHALGAAAFLNISDYTKNGEQEMRSDIERTLPIAFQRTWALSSEKLDAR